MALRVMIKEEPEAQELSKNQDGTRSLQEFASNDLTKPMENAFQNKVKILPKPGKSSKVFQFNS